MNPTHIEHILIAAVIQLALWPVFGPWAAGGIAVAIFLGREIAQHEYRLALDRDWTWGDQLPVAWYEGLLHGWSLDSALDVLLPAAGCILIALLIRRFPAMPWKRSPRRYQGRQPRRRAVARKPPPP